MTGPKNNGQRYTVHCSGAVAQSLKEIQERASWQGGGKAVTVAFSNLIEKLRTAPYEVGDPAYHLPMLRIQMRTVLVPPLIVHFGICEDRPEVYLKGVKLWE